MRIHTRLDPATRRFLAELGHGNHSADNTDLEALRRHAREVEGPGVRPARVDIEKRIASDRCDRQVPITIVRPPNSTEPLPAVIYLHGGGWVFGDEQTHEWVISELAVAAGVAVIFVHYSLSPESRFPVAIEETLTVLEWIGSRGAEANLRPGSVAIAGDSAGGNMAAVVSLLAPARALPAPACQVLFYPTTDAGRTFPSMRRYATGHYLTAEGLGWSRRQYLLEPSLVADSRVSPLRATRSQLAASPVTLIITAECDPLRDEGEAYARRLSDAGVPVVTTRYLGTIHAFLTIRALARTPAPRSAIDQAAAMLRATLHRGGA